METWTGGCLCGAIRYEATPTEPENLYCHCRMCQRWTGSVVATGTIVKKHEFKITKGEPTFFESSHYAERGFCTNCGSPLIFRAVEEDWLAIQTGTFDNPEVAPPVAHYGVEGRISWLTIVDDLPHVRTEEDEWQQKHSGKQ